MAEVNKVLRAPVSDRKKAWMHLMNSEELPQSLNSKLKLSRFLDGELVVYSTKKLMAATEDRPGYITCTVCEHEFKFQKCARVLEHVLSERHQKKCQGKLMATEKAQSQAVMEDSFTSAASKLNEVQLFLSLLFNIAI